MADNIGHALGVGASIAMPIMLVLVAKRYSGALPVISFALYGGTLLLGFSASAPYNIVAHGVLRWGLRLLDHSSIYLMISGA